MTAPELNPNHWGFQLETSVTIVKFSKMPTIFMVYLLVACSIYPTNHLLSPTMYIEVDRN